MGVVAMGADGEGGPSEDRGEGAVVAVEIAAVGDGGDPTEGRCNGHDGVDGRKVRWRWDGGLVQVVQARI